MTIKINGDNSVANPGFTGADTDTGLQVGTNELKLVTGGTAQVTVSSSGLATFAGEVESGSNPYSSGSYGVKLEDLGRISVRRAGATDITFASYPASGTSPNVTILGNGSATFGGTVNTGATGTGVFLYNDGTFQSWNGGNLRASIATNGGATFKGANAPSGLDTRITQYGSLLVGTDSDTVSAARCSIDAGNGNISSNGTGTFNGVVKADRSAAGDGCFHAALSGTVKAAINSNGTGYFLGSLGAGTSIPATKLHVDGGSTGSAVTIDNGGYGTMRMGAAANGSNLISVGTGEKLVFGHQSAAGTTYTERMRMLATGGLTFNGDTAQANALDDYEEGTWTPSIGGNATYNALEGNYIKIGHLVIAHFRVGVNTQGTGNTSGSIYNLPFNSAKAAQNTSALTWGSTGVSIAYGVYYVGANSNTLSFSYTAGAQASLTNNPNLFANGASINGSIMYICT